MKRVLVIGSGGSGKSTFSQKLAAKTGLPLFHLDALFWKPGWLAPGSADWHKTVAALIEQDNWILDGNYGGTLELRLSKADTIFFLDMPNWRCVWNLVKRRIKYARITRPGMPAGCPEKINFTFLAWVWGYPKRNKPKVLNSIETHKQADAKVLIFKSYEAMETFLKSI